jgi:putative PIG3 family NAD(P)H quinone oxidoreductase
MPNSLPDQMTCIGISEPGAPEVLKAEIRPLPKPGPGEVLIRVAAAGINRPDLMQRQGLYPAPPGASDIPGLEAAGTIAALGGGINRWNEGDAVTALLTGGGYAEYCLAAEGCCLPVPNGLSMTEAAGLPETFFTVWTNVFERAGLRPGETFMVHGGSSGIGTAAIQIASRLGARVIATAGSAEKCRACLELGAERAVNYHDEDFVAAAKEFTAPESDGKGGAKKGKGVDVILDMVGGDYIQRNIKALAAEGRLVNIAYLKGSKAEVNFLPVMLKRLTLTGSTLRIQPSARKAEIAQALKERVWPLIEAGEIKPVIHAAFALEKAAAAHALMEEGAHIGKIVLEVPA